MESEIILTEEGLEKAQDLIDSLLGSSSTVKLFEDAIYFDGDVTPRSANQIALIIAYQEKKKADCVDKTQRIYISTYGGEVYSAFKIYDILKKSSLSIEIVIQGIVASAGSIISCAGDKILMSENAFLMLHEISSESFGKFNEQKTQMTHTEVMMNKIVKIYVDRTDNKAIDFGWLEKDRYFSAQEALEFKLVDEII